MGNNNNISIDNICNCKYRPYNSNDSKTALSHFDK